MSRAKSKMLKKITVKMSFMLQTCMKSGHSSNELFLLPFFLCTFQTSFQNFLLFKWALQFALDQILFCEAHEETIWKHEQTKLATPCQSIPNEDGFLNEASVQLKKVPLTFVQNKNEPRGRHLVQPCNLYSKHNKSIKHISRRKTTQRHADMHGWHKKGHAGRDTVSFTLRKAAECFFQKLEQCWQKSLFGHSFFPKMNNFLLKSESFCSFFVSWRR